METESLKATHLSKSFGNVSLLASIDLEVPLGCSVSICGASGTGKTTLLSILAGFEEPDEGCVYWGKNRLSEQAYLWRRAHRQKHSGFVFQNAALISELSVKDNVLLPLRLRGRLSSAQEQEAYVLLCRLGLRDCLTTCVSRLSFGQAQRVAMARALIGRPKWLFADEPTGNLDERSAAVVAEALFEMCHLRRCALVLVTHHLALGRRADQALRLVGGHLESLKEGD